MGTGIGMLCTWPFTFSINLRLLRKRKKKIYLLKQHKTKQIFLSELTLNTRAVESTEGE